MNKQLVSKAIMLTKCGLVIRKREMDFSVMQYVGMGTLTVFL
jgi:hypothetical protein